MGLILTTRSLPSFVITPRATAYDFFAVARQITTADISDLIRAYFRGGY
jgi:hypothetical protein